MTRLIRRVVVAVAVLVLSLTASESAMAQTCASFCLPCVGAPSPDWVYGGGAAHGSPYLAYCTMGGCSACGVELEKSRNERPEDVLSRLRSAPENEFNAIVRASVNRILVHREKSMVVVLGGCDGKAVVGVTFLSRDRIAAIEKRGAQSLKAFLATASDVAVSQGGN